MFSSGQEPGRSASAAVAVVRLELAEVVLQPAQIAPRPRAVERPVVDDLQVTAALVVEPQPAAPAVQEQRRAHVRPAVDVLQAEDALPRHLERRAGGLRTSDETGESVFHLAV